MQKARKGLGRGLSALIPAADMDFLTRVARGEDVEDLQGEKSVVQKSKKSTTSSGKLQTPLASKAVISSKNARKVSKETSSVTSQSKLRSIAHIISLASIEANPFQPRHTFDDEEMQELVASIREHGVLQPILIRPIEFPSGNKSPAAKQDRPKSTVEYQLIAGERRWRAAQQAGLTDIPAVVRRVTDQQALELAIIENVQRHDISSLDAAQAYQRLSQEFSLSQEEIAKSVGKSRVSISNTIRLLDLPQEVKNSLADGTISEGHGRAILLSATDGARRAVFRRLLREKLSVRATEELARSTQSQGSESDLSSEQGNSNPKAKSESRSLPEIRRIEDGLQKHLGTRVCLRPRKKGGQVVIQYFSNEELERLLKIIIRPR